MTAESRSREADCLYRKGGLVYNGRETADNAGEWETNNGRAPSQAGDAIAKRQQPMVDAALKFPYTCPDEGFYSPILNLKS